MMWNIKLIIKCNLVSGMIFSQCVVYLKGILAEILQFVMGKGLISADGEIWRVRRRAIVPALHLKVNEFTSPRNFVALTF